MLIKIGDAVEVNNSPVCKVSEYRFEMPNLSFATAVVTGRFPSSGMHRNTEVEEVVFVISGKGRIVTGDKEYELQQGDSFLVEKNSWHALDGSDLHLAMFSTPAWSFDQLEPDTN